MGCSAGKFAETIKGAGRPMDLAHRLEQQVLQGGMKVFSHEYPVRDGKQADVRIGNVPGQADETSR